MDKISRHQALQPSLDELQLLSIKLNRGKLRTRTAIRNAVTAVLRRHGMRGRGLLTEGIEQVAGASKGKRRSARNQCVLGLHPSHRCDSRQNRAKAPRREPNRLAVDSAGVLGQALEGTKI